MHLDKFFNQKYERVSKFIDKANENLGVKKSPFLLKKNASKLKGNKKTKSKFQEEETEKALYVRVLAAIGQSEKNGGDLFSERPLTRAERQIKTI